MDKRTSVRAIQGFDDLHGDAHRFTLLSGRSCRIRTDDILGVNETLYHLS